MMEQAERDRMIAHSAVKFTASRLARIEAKIAQHGLRPDTAADLWVARRAAAYALARLGVPNVATGG